jgi:hypothetical protein
MRFKMLAVLAVLGLLGTVAPSTTVSADSLPPPILTSHFGRMFPGLPALNTQTNQQVADLAASMLDPNITDPAAGSKDDHGSPSGITYFGQFIDHDLTLDTSASPTADVDPTTLTSGRTFRFDLDSVYCGGPFVTPQIYAADHLHFLVGSNANGVRDLPRNADGSAILCEHRNDENEIVSQWQVAFLSFHNALVDKLHMGFAAAYLTTVHYYQWMVVHEFLPTIVGQSVVDGILNGSIPRFYKPGSLLAPMVPIEFSVAAYRFGHSIVRKAYQVTDQTGKLQVFNGTAADLSGGRPLPAGRQIDWSNFVLQLSSGGDTPGSPFTGGVEAGPTSVSDPNFNFSRNIDLLISSGLFDLPIPGAEASGPNVLAYRNMIRAKFYDMPSGQSVAAAMGVPVIPASAFTTAQALGPQWANGVPLWYYILGEADMVNGGKVLGPVGARIVADVMLRILQDDPLSILGLGNKIFPFTPKAPVASVPGKFGMADFLVFAGVATRP